MNNRGVTGHPAYASPSSSWDRASGGDRWPGARKDGGEAASDPDTPPLLDAVLRENEALQVKLARVSHAIHGLVADLAAARRECRNREREIEALRGENAALTAAAPGTGVASVLRVRRLGAAGGLEGPELSP